MLPRRRYAIHRRHSEMSFMPWILLLVLAAAGLVVFAALFKVPERVFGLGLALVEGELRQILSPTRGTVERFLKEEGDSIRVGDPVAIIQIDDGEDEFKTVFAQFDGVIAEIIAYPNTVVKKGQALTLVTKGDDNLHGLEILGFVSSLEGKAIKPGMKAQVFPSITKPYVHGHIVATVKRIGKLPMSLSAVQSAIKIPEVGNYIRNKLDAEPISVTLTLEKDPTHKTGYRWSGAGPDYEIDSGMITDFAVIIDEPSLLSYLWPSFGLIKRGER